MENKTVQEDMARAWQHAYEQAMDANADLLRERDEARAEVERLRAALVCPCSYFVPATHRCVRCDNEVG